jgi:HEAT repeat protein
MCPFRTSGHGVLGRARSLLVIGLVVIVCVALCRGLLFVALMQFDLVGVTALIRNLSERGELHRSVVLSALIRKGDAAIEPLSNAATSDSRVDVREGALCALGRIAMAYPSMRPELRQCAENAARQAMQDESALVRARAAQTTWRLTFRSELVITALLDAWRCDDMPVKYLAIETFQDMGPAAKAAEHELTLSLSDSRSMVRLWATNALSAIQGQQDRSRVVD